jgi:hypothetical protein
MSEKSPRRQLARLSADHSSTEASHWKQSHWKQEKPRYCASCTYSTDAFGWGIAVGAAPRSIRRIRGTSGACVLNAHRATSLAHFNPAFLRISISVLGASSSR